MREIIREEIRKEQETSENQGEQEGKEERSKISRRSFLKTLGLGAGGLALSSQVAGWALYQPESQGESDIDASQLQGNSLSEVRNHDHSNLSNINADDHHAKYTDSEAVAAVESHGEPIEFTDRADFGSGIRVDVGQDISDSNGEPRMAFGSADNRVYAGSSFEFNIYDRQGTFEAVKYIPSSSAPGTLELTNADIDADGQVIKNAGQLSFTSNEIIVLSSLTLDAGDGSDVNGSRYTTYTNSSSSLHLGNLIGEIPNPSDYISFGTPVYRATAWGENTTDGETCSVSFRLADGFENYSTISEFSILIDRNSTDNLRPHSTGWITGIEDTYNMPLGPGSVQFSVSGGEGHVKRGSVMIEFGVRL